MGSQGLSRPETEQYNLYAARSLVTKIQISFDYTRVTSTSFSSKGILGRIEGTPEVQNKIPCLRDVTCYRNR
jgi:hypothetical protein